MYLHVINFIFNFIIRGQDLDTYTTPLECGRTWRVKFDKKFIGRDALLKQKENGVKRIYIQLLLDDHDADIDIWPSGSEPIFRDGKICGQTTTTSFGDTFLIILDEEGNLIEISSKTGFTFQKQVCLGFVQNIDADGNFQPITSRMTTKASDHHYFSSM